MILLKMFWRKYMDYHRKRMTSEECRILSNKIQNTVLELPEWKSAGNINIYKSIGNEVSTDKLIYDAEIRSNKEIYYPTPEPRDNVADIDLVIVPGLVFDKKCARYGRGGGYYDRFLDTLPKRTCIIGVAYDFQVLSWKWKLKLNEYDVKMDYIITERRIIQKRGMLIYS